MFAFQTASFVSPKEEVRAHIASLSFMRTTNTMVQAGDFPTTKEAMLTCLIVQVLTVERSCLCRELLNTDDDFHLNLGFNFSTQTMFFTLNLD